MIFNKVTTQEIFKYNPRCFLVYSDNILEGTNTLDLISDNNEFLDLVGISFEPIDQPIYLFKEKKDSSYLCVKVLGRYENWDLPDNVSSIIKFIDKPDFVFIDCFDNTCVFVGETTGTANVGNSQWQREGRKISAAKHKIPMIYQTYYTGTDRSMFKQTEIDSRKASGTVREPTSVQVLNHLIYSMRYQVPSLVIYYNNPAHDKTVGFKRDNKGVDLLKHYISLCLLLKVNKDYKLEKKKIEVEIFKRMISFVTEKVISRKKELYRIDKDFPVEPARSILINRKNEFINFLVDYVNGDCLFKEEFNITAWDLSKFFLWSHTYKTTKLLVLLEKEKLETYSYLKGGTKVGFVIDTPRLITLLKSFFSKSSNCFASKIDFSLPTLIIPTLMFQKKDEKYVYKVDPGTGEIVAFSELFTKDINSNKVMNVLIYVSTSGPDDFTVPPKLKKSFKQYASCLIINEKLYDEI